MPAGERVLAAVSGGPDSTALLLALVELGRDVVAAHFDHDLREGSGEDAVWVAALCEGLGVPLIAGVRSRALPHGSLQAAARELRGEFLEQARSSAGAGRVALAHTAGDVVEGVLLHLLRGSGLAGLRGMPARRGHLVRPMLSIWREEVDAHLAACGIAARSDPSNSDPRYARVRVRLELLPALEASRPGLSTRLQAVAVRAAGWQAQAEAAAARLCPPGEAATRVADLRAAGPVIRAEAYRLLYRRAGGPSPGLARRHLDAVDGLVMSPGRPRSLDLPGAVVAACAYGELAMRAGPRPPAPSWRLATRPCPGCQEPGAAHLRAGLALALGTRRPGLTMRPVHGHGTRKLQDILVDARVPRAERDRLPLVFAAGKLALVPGLAVSREFAAPPGEGGLHVTVERVPRRPGRRSGREGGPDVL